MPSTLPAWPRLPVIVLTVRANARQKGTGSGKRTMTGNRQRLRITWRESGYGQWERSRTPSPAEPRSLPRRLLQRGPAPSYLPTKGAHPLRNPPCRGFKSTTDILLTIHASRLTSDGVLERAMGFEPTTTCLGSKDSTTELRPPRIDEER